MEEELKKKITMEKEDLKKTRVQKKANLIQLQSRLIKLQEEEDKEGLVKCLDTIKRAFMVFEDIHDQYHDKLDSEVDIEESDTYFLEVEKLEAHITAQLLEARNTEFE